MAQRRVLAGLLIVSLIVNAFCVPSGFRLRRGYADNELDESLSSKSSALTSDASEASSTTSKTVLSAKSDTEDDDDDEEFQVTPSSSPSSGSNILTLLNLVSGLFPGSSSSNVKIRKLLKQFILKNKSAIQKIIRRLDRQDSEVDTNFILDLKPPPKPFQRQETEENDSNESGDSQSDTQESLEEDNGGTEESIENNSKPAKQSSDSEAASDGNDDDDYDLDEPPGGGDGAGGGILGLLAGLSGSEDGQSDLGSLLAAVSGIVASLSGDGFDLNALIASGIGLFVGLLSEGEENPGAVIASYLLTSLDTITGGGANNNGAFFGNFLSKLLAGSSAGGDPDASSEEGGMPMKDSGGFFASLLMGLLGEMSKTSSSGSKQW